MVRALKAMHQYRVKDAPGGIEAQRKARGVRHEAADADKDAARKAQGRKARRNKSLDRDQDYVEQEPLMGAAVTRSQEGVEEGEDLHVSRCQARYVYGTEAKPITTCAIEQIYWSNAGNIMIADDGKTPILMDMGCLAPSPTPISSHSLRLAVQDTTEHSTMPYRAPELFNVKTGSMIDAKVDVWSFSCTLYACFVGKSSFEAHSKETGGSLSICTLSGDWRFPDEVGRRMGRARTRTRTRGRRWWGKIGGLPRAFGRW